MSNADLCAVLALSAQMVSQLRGGQYRLEPGSKPFELAQHLLRLFRSLNSWLGQNDAAVRRWLATPNLDLGTAPIELIATAGGLLRTTVYVDALRGQV